MLFVSNSNKFQFFFYFWRQYRLNNRRKSDSLGVHPLFLFFLVLSIASVVHHWQHFVLFAKPSRLDVSVFFLLVV